MTYGSNLFSAYYNAQLTAKAYVQDGLIAMWDGIENAGWGVHNPSAASWKDLAGSNNLVVPSGMAWNTDSLQFDGRSGHYLNTNTRFGNLNDYAFEIVFKRDLFATYASSFSCVQGGGAGWQVKRGDAKESVLVGKPSGEWYSSASGSAIYDELVTRHYKALIADTTNGKIYQSINGVYVEQILSYTGTRWNNYTFCIGTDAGDYVPMTGHVCAVRVYQRALTAAEIAHNYSIDKARFNIQ